MRIKPSTVKRRMTRADAASFERAIAKAPKVRDVAAIRKELCTRNYVRWLRLQRDFAWMQKEMKKMGYNPEDARQII